MKYLETLSLRWRELTTYLLAQDVPISTRSIADGARKLLTTPLQTLARLVVISPPRLLIFLTLIALSLIGAWITWTFSTP